MFFLIFPEKSIIQVLEIVNVGLLLYKTYETTSTGGNDSCISTKAENWTK